MLYLTNLNSGHRIHIKSAQNTPALITASLCSWLYFTQFTMFLFLSYFPLYDIFSFWISWYYLKFKHSSPIIFQPSFFHLKDFKLFIEQYQLNWLAVKIPNLAGRLLAFPALIRGRSLHKGSFPLLMTPCSVKGPIWILLSHSVSLFYFDYSLYGFYITLQ